MEALIHSIRAALEDADFGGRGHELAWVAGDVVTNGATPEAVQTAIDYLIKLGEVEEYQEEKYKVEPPSPALRLVGEAKLLADKRNRVRHELQIQEALPLPFPYVDAEAYEMSKRSMVFQPPTADSMWWQARLWQRHNEIPFEQIRSGDWSGPVVLPFRITYPWGKDNHDYNLPFRMTVTGRVCGFYEIAFDCFLRPDPDVVFLVGRLPGDIIDILGVTAIDGIYVWGSVNAIDDMPAAQPQSPNDAPIPSTQSAENSEAGSEQDPDGYSNIAIFPSDETTADFVQSALGQAGITCGMWQSRGTVVSVRNRWKEQAIAILREDSQRYHYRINGMKDSVASQQ